MVPYARLQQSLSPLPLDLPPEKRFVSEPEQDNNRKNRALFREQIGHHTYSGGQSDATFAGYSANELRAAETRASVFRRQLGVCSGASLHMGLEARMLDM